VAGVYNISSGKSFADSFVKGLLERVKGDQLELSKYLLLLPSRRACRALADAFLRASDGKPMLLPQMQPIGDVDAEEIAILGEKDINTMPAISRLDRQLLLARLIQKTDDTQSFDQAVSMAIELGKFLDEVQTERLKFEDLEKVVPDEFAEHWQKTLEFLKILTQFWPSILEDCGYIDIAERRNSLIEARIEEWQNNPPNRNVIAVGSIGPIPAVAELIALVANLPLGEVVLPGVDMRLDDDSWKKIDEDHPQYMIKKLLAKIKINRSDISEWNNDDVVNAERVKLISEAMRPADTTDKWRSLTIEDISEHALAGISQINCATSQEEAEVIALIMREVLEEPAKTCALVTSDRRLARRVTQSLKRWNVAIDDSGGQPLTEFPVGSYLTALAECALDNLSPISLLSLLKHPLTALGIEGAKLRDNIQFLDEYVLRGPRHSGGFKGLRMQAENCGNEEFFNWLTLLENNIGEFLQLMTSGKEQNFADLLKSHIEVAEKIASTLDKSGANRIWHGEAGEAANKFVKELLASASNIPDILPSNYLALFGMLLKGNTVRPRFGRHPRLSILGQIEARLYCADMVILGGLNEGTWPKIAGDDPWMSRPMRKSFGLPLPEKEISLSAHDFSQLACAKEVVLTRARKVDGTPTVPARWLLRIETVLNALGLKMNKINEHKYRKWLSLIDAPSEIKSATRPMPCPPLDARPKQLAATYIEKLMRDPYQIYAKYILNLKPLDDLDADAGGAERGTFIHEALEKFVKEFEKEIPDNAEEKLLQFGQEALEHLHIADEVKAYWWPRFEQVAKIFVEEERKQREIALPVATESTGKIVLENGFTVTAKADRLDKFNSGGYAIIDYKSGYVPNNTEVKDGLSPQLPLEGLILEQGGFEGIASDKVEDLIYWKVTGGGQEPVEIQHVNPRSTSVEQLITEAHDGILELSSHFMKEDSAYISYPRQDIKAGYTDYEHLSRVKEWGILGDE